jgi:hypothetical protein
MIIPVDFIREDGVKLIKRYDAVIVGYDENGMPIYKPSGYKIHKVGTDSYYNEAIDIENAPFRYEETDEKISEEENE